jgi:hypothetical protein
VELYRCPEEGCPSRHLCGHAVAHERHNCQQMGDCPSCRPLKTRTLWQVVRPDGQWDVHGTFRCRAGALVYAQSQAHTMGGNRRARRAGWRAIKTTQVEG